MSNAPWHGIERQYVGWVPNVLGHISFSLIGQRTFPQAYCTTYECDDGRQLVAAYQRRHADDYAWPKWISRWTRPRSVHDWFFLGETEEISYPSAKEAPAYDPNCHRFQDNRGMLSGYVHVIAPSEDMSGLRQNIEFRLNRWRLRSRIRHAISTVSRSDSKSNLQNRMLLNIFQKGVDEFTLPTACVRACLVRTGEVRFWFDEVSGEGDRASHDAVAQIAYYFLKDISHLHTNHAHSQDSMVPFLPIDGATLAGEKEWQRRTIWALTRSAEELIRQGTRRSLRSALGLLPFAENFHSLYGGMVRAPGSRHKFVSIKDHEFDHYNFEGMRKLVSCALDAKISDLTRKAAMWSITIPISLATITGISNLAGGPNLPHWSQKLKFFTQNHPQWALLAVLFILWVIFSWTYGERDDQGFPFGPYRAFTRAFRAMTVSATRSGLLGHRFWWFALMFALAVSAAGLFRASLYFAIQ